MYISTSISPFFMFSNMINFLSFHLSCLPSPGYLLRAKGFPRSSNGKESACSGRPGFNPWVGKIHWRRKWQPTPVFLLGESHVQRSLAGYSPWGRKELDVTEANQHACVIKQAGYLSCCLALCFLSSQVRVEKNRVEIPSSSHTEDFSHSVMVQLLKCRSPAD